ncbi:MAG: AEC family transporter [Candidatus Thorarchaeota archaeon]|nr:AEC family transporter [Candidatus Thorarchaeota archaeon]
MFTLQSIVDTTIQFGLFYGFILIGYLLAKLSGKGKEANHYLNLVLINILIPILFIYTLLTASPDAMTELPLIIAIAVLVHLLGPALMYIHLKRRDYDNSTKGVFYICVTFNNALFIPLPLVLLFIGSAGLPIVIIFSLTQMILLATLGSFMGAVFGGENGGYRKVTKDALTFPPFVAAILAVILFLANFQLPDNIAYYLSFTGPVTTYLALIAVGLGVGVRFSLIEIRAALEVVGIRQFLIPIITIPIIIFSGLSHLPASILILEALMPPAVLTVIYAKSFKLDSEKASTIVTVGTLFLLPIIPFIPFLLS